jgi:sec-independent protein translocase protein TatB
MFDIGFSEILVIAVVALLVLGPERLPKIARFAGLWLRRARMQWNSIKDELENELSDDELLRNVRQAHSDVHDGLRSTRESIELPSVDHLPSGNGATTSLLMEPPAKCEVPVMKPTHD